MSNEIALFTLAGLKFSARPSAVAGYLLLWLLFSVSAGVGLREPIGSAVLGGFFATFIHYASDGIHHWGHARAARGTGYPMLGVRYWGVLGTSVYPADEPPLPARIHIRRALGGPIVTLTLGAVLSVGAFALSSAGGWLFWLTAWAALDNAVILGLGAFLPLSFSDGGTLLKYRGQP